MEITGIEKIGKTIKQQNSCTCTRKVLQDAKQFAHSTIFRLNFTRTKRVNRECWSLFITWVAREPLSNRLCLLLFAKEICLRAPHYMKLFRRSFRVNCKRFLFRNPTGIHKGTASYWPRVSVYLCTSLKHCH